MHLPGSFTKNLGLGDNGLGLLHEAIGAGFGKELAPISRKQWRLACTALDSDRQLVALNFFLCSDGNYVLVDELVRLSLQAPHSPEWDLVALFALNLGQPGVGLRAGINKETSWANEFIRAVVATDDGTWDRSTITRGSFDAFLAQHMGAKPRSRIKVRNNYLYILRLCGITPRGLFNILIEPERWLGNALFLAWDRYSVRGYPLDQTILEASVRDELHKVAGVRGDVFWDIAREAFETYVELGGLRRFGEH